MEEIVRYGRPDVRPRNAREAHANLIAAYVQAHRTSRREDNSPEETSYWQRIARKYRGALKEIAEGADPVEVHARVTGSRVFA